jgi:hypothetical protein
MYSARDIVPIVALSRIAAFAAPHARDVQMPEHEPGVPPYVLDRGKATDPAAVLGEEARLPGRRALRRPRDVRDGSVPAGENNDPGSRSPRCPTTYTGGPASTVATRQGQSLRSRSLPRGRRWFDRQCTSTARADSRTRCDPPSHAGAWLRAPGGALAGQRMHGPSPLLFGDPSGCRGAGPSQTAPSRGEFSEMPSPQRFGNAARALRASCHSP